MRLFIIALLLPLCLSACSDAATPNNNQLSPAPAALVKNNQATKLNPQPEVPATRDNIKKVHQQLQTQIADLNCDNSSQCKVLPVGSRACGGPSSYIVYSNKTANEQAVEKLTQQITSLESQFNAQNKMISICQHLTAPAAQCIENKCVKLESSATSVY
ncbi:hypothetical protein [Pseudoalteromonas sp. SG44-17]|uniref:hypothetical protein n=1 Tax=Pseudoalteromonas sp. SG44-17 TaxID=2760963 RepID=UPI0016036E2A|nr:hypothetical protein [Pseudoalteromonas sp. SG44-17]MBB1411352.1 hypothetical protein [Pseudoalteromonas sp. SG44-17]